MTEQPFQKTLRTKNLWVLLGDYLGAKPAGVKVNAIEDLVAQV